MKPAVSLAIAQVSPYAPIFAVNMACIPVMSTQRNIGRKEQAALTRKLFHQLGIKGVSVTAPNYSMAQSVDVRVPTIERQGDDYLFDGKSYEHDTYSDMPDGVPAKAKQRAKYEAEKRIGEILDCAFPNHDDRSDSQSDHFDYCWSIN